jgi:dCMP deaminase
MIISDGYNGTPSGFENVCELEDGTTKGYVLHAEANAIISAPRSAMLGSSLFLCGVEVSDGSYIAHSNSCSMCKRMIINAGIETVYVRDTKDEYREIKVSEWIENDESIIGTTGY